MAQKIGMWRAIASPLAMCTAVVVLLIVACAACDASPQRASEVDPATESPGDEAAISAPDRVEVQPTSDDSAIATRIERVLEATEWFDAPSVRVDEGVVFLSGATQTEELKRWAGDLARNTRDVVAVVNRMTVTDESVWDLQPAWRGLLALWREFVHALPLLLVGVLILAGSLVIALLARRGARTVLRGRIQSRLLRQVIATGVGAVVFLVGTYIVLRVSGLTQLALTVLGGTGLLGLILGIAFRDITENFLASIFLSVQRPFETGDLVDVAGIMGFVQQLNMRTSMLMTLDGNLVQIPNATIYKSNIVNFTTNANRRDDFIVGIGYDDAISEAQEIARGVLAEHPAVLRDPEPWVLVESLGSATVNLRVYFWLNGREHSWLKVRSSVIRMVKSAFQSSGISMPDEAREVVFPKGIPIIRDVEHRDTELPPQQQTSRTVERSADRASSPAEGGLESEASDIKRQAQQAELLEASENLLEGESR